MRFEPNCFYHFYNRGNNKQPIFFSEANYRCFLRKAANALTPYCDVLAYCLMPNHFHFLIFTKPVVGSGQTTGSGNQDRGVRQPTSKNKRSQLSAHSRPTTEPSQLQPLTRSLAHMLSSYTRAINNQNGTTGSLFQQKSKAKKLESDGQPLTCFHYIHQNPLRSRMVGVMEDWPHSSYRQYQQMDPSGICNIEMAVELLDIDLKAFVQDSFLAIDPAKVPHLFQ